MIFFRFASWISVLFLTGVLPHGTAYAERGEGRDDQAVIAQSANASVNVALRDLGRFRGWRDNALVGYGLVTGLAGSGDSSRNAVTQQMLQNILNRLGTNIAVDKITSRNVAVVMVTANLPASANTGDRIDVTVSSIGDARSLAGGTLLMTPLNGPDQQVYALAQGGLVTGGYRFDVNQNRRQRNYPTSAIMPNGATIERDIGANVLSPDNTLSFILREPSFSTAQYVADGINSRFGGPIAQVVDADEIRIAVNEGRQGLFRFLSQLEEVRIKPAMSSRVVIDEKSGTVVAGGNVQISSVVIAQGDIRISVNSFNEASQPALIGGFAPNVGSLVISNTELDVEEERNDTAITFPNTTVATLVDGLYRAEIDTRRIITILQSIKAAGALHADIVVR